MVIRLSNFLSHLEKFVLFCVIFCMAGLLHSPAQDIGFTASIDRERVYVGESLILTLTITNGKPSNLTSFPDIEGVEVKSLGTRSNISWLNGVQMQSQTYNYLLTPQRAGDFEIPEFVVTVNGRIYSSQPKTFQALPRDRSNETSSDLELYGAFLKVVNPPDQVYVGQIIPVELRLYYKEGANISYPSLSGDGWRFGKTTGNEMGRQVFDGQVFNLAVFQFSATAYKTGQLKLGPFDCEMSIPVDDGRSRRGNSFFGFNTRRMQKITLSTSDPIEVTSLPLPRAEAPPSFNGAIGRFDLQVTPLSTEVKEGDPITLKLRVYGEGNFKSISFPMPETWQNFKSYPPEVSWEPQNELEIRGIKVFELTIVPNDREVQEIPMIEWCYFDPEKSKYELVQRGPYKIKVNPSDNQTNVIPESFSANADTIPGIDPQWAHIKPRIGSDGTFTLAWTHTTWFWALEGAPWLGFLVFLGWNQWLRPKSNMRKEDPARKLRQYWLKNCQDLKKDLENSDWQGFYSSLYRGIQMALGCYWGIPSESITQDTIEVQNQQKSLPEPLLETVHDLFNKCDQIRYAPFRGGLKEMKEDFPKVEELVEFVGGEMDKAKTAIKEA